MIEVFKFGGASVKDAEGIKNVGRIVKLNESKKLLIVVSAMGKVTNQLEEVTQAYLKNDLETAHQKLDSIKKYHEAILSELFDRGNKVFDDIANTFVEIEWILEEEPHEDEDFIYDQIVSIGELVSSRIVSAHLNASGSANSWLDARSYIHTDNTYREGQVNWEKTKSAIEKLIESDKLPSVTQGFIGGTSENYTTTLGREGSDYSAAIFAYCLNAAAVTIWKDVPGVLNADPKIFSNTTKYDLLSYSEALEMTYYGATVIHPKTIKPLQNCNIPLIVKPFMAPTEAGTVIKPGISTPIETPAIILKKNQALVSLTTKDVSFITENHLSDIYKIFADLHVKINLMQISAISLSVCIDFVEGKFERLKKALSGEFSFRYNAQLELITVRHFNQILLDELTAGKVILMEQLSRNTAQFVRKSE